MNTPPDGSVESLAQLLVSANKFHHVVKTAKDIAPNQISPRLYAAWQAGGLLIEAKKIVPHGEWEDFVAEHFDGALASAKRYMQVRKSLTTVSDLDGKTLQEIYIKLKMIKKDHFNDAEKENPTHMGKHIYLAQQLARIVRMSADSSDMDHRNRLREDLKPLMTAISRL